jgi:hypothetical protein
MGLIAAQGKRELKARAGRTWLCLSHMLDKA